MTERNDRILTFIVWYNLLFLGYHDKKVTYHNFHDEEDDKLISFHPHREYCLLKLTPRQGDKIIHSFKWYNN